LLGDDHDMSINRRPGTRGPWVTDRAFAEGRDRTLNQLVRVGVPRAHAHAWVTAWDVTTAGLVDFRRAPDFWRLGYEYAREEYVRGFAPPTLGASSAPRPALADPAEERAHAQ
jgi:hypothetical protein